MKGETIGQKASPGESATEGNESVPVRAEVLAGKFTKTKGKVDGLNGTNMWSLMQEKFGLTGDQLVQLRQALVPAKVQGNPGTLVRIFSPASCKEKGVTVQDFDSLNEHPELILHEGYYWGRGGPGEIVVEEKPKVGSSLVEKKLQEGAITEVGITRKATGSQKALARLGHFLLYGGFLLVIVLVVGLVILFSSC